jgi:hypothetical protein
MKLAGFQKFVMVGFPSFNKVQAIINSNRTVNAVGKLVLWSEKENNEMKEFCRRRRVSEVERDERSPSLREWMN